MRYKKQLYLFLYVSLFIIISSFTVLFISFSDNLKGLIALVLIFILFLLFVAILFRRVQKEIIIHQNEFKEERKLLEESLEKEKYFLDALMDNMPDAIYFKDKESKLMRVSRSMADRFDVSLDSLIGMSDFDFQDEIHAKEAFEDEQNIQKTGKPKIDYIEKEMNEDGSESWVSTTKMPLINTQGELVGTFGISRDITSRKLAEMALNNSEARYRQIVETAQEGIWMLDEHNYTIFVNKKMCEMLEYSREEMMGKQNYYFKDEEGKKKAKHDIERRKAGITEDQTSKFITKNGKVVWTNLSTNPIFDDGGKYLGALGMFTDITSKRKAAEELVEAQQKFQAIFDNTADGIYQSTPEGKFIMANPSMARIFGYASPDDLLCSITDIATQIYANAAERKKMSALLLQEGYINDLELEVLTKKKDIIWVSVNIRIVRDEKGNVSYFEGTLENITERKRAEEEIWQLNQNLDQFAKITAHDLQEPIRMVSGFLGLLDKKYSAGIDEQGKNYIYRAKDGADRMSILITDLLEFSRSGNKSAKKESVDLAVVMDLVKKDLSIAIADTGTILHLPACLPVVVGTQSALYRLFLNLVSNGIKFRKKDIVPEITLTINDSMDFWEFTLQDNGIGIADKDQSKLFHAFQRLHRREEYPGTGLGLVTCKKIVETHGGKIGIVSDQGKGASIHFTIKK